MSHRIISGLVLAAPCPRPARLPVARLRGTKRLGIKYEKDFAKTLEGSFPGSCLAGQWFHFVDVNGPGYCQPDLLLKLPHEIVIFECKLTDTEQGRSQIAHLYAPVVEKAFGLPSRGIVVTRHLTRETEIALVCDRLPMAVKFKRGVIPTLHWRERSPL